MSTNICFIYTYTWNPINETKRLAYLKRLINECHRRGIHAIMDGVFNHADATPPDRGFRTIGSTKIPQTPRTSGTLRKQRFSRIWITLIPVLQTALTEAACLFLQHDFRKDTAMVGDRRLARIDRTRLGIPRIEDDSA